MSDDDCKEKCCAYLCFAFIVLAIIVTFWQLILLIIAIVIIIYCIYWAVMNWDLPKFSWKGSDDYTHTPRPRQLYESDYKEPPKRVSWTTGLSVEETIEEILHQKPKYTRNDILTMIRETRGELGLETTTDEVAVNIVVAELGVELSPKRGRPRKTRTPRRDSETYIDPNGYKRYSDSEEPPREISRTYIDHNGYRRYSDTKRLVHIHIAEVHVVGRKLREDEVVHHINGNKLDNRASNLRVMTWDEHRDLHDRQRHH